MAGVRVFVTLLICALVAAGPKGAMAQGVFVLEDVMHGTHVRKQSDTPVHWDVAENGYIASFSSRYNSRCVGSYRVMFTFDRDIRTIPDGGRFGVRIRKLTGKSPCGFRKSRARVSASNGWTNRIVPELPASYDTRNGNMSPSNNRIGMWDGAKTQMDVIVTAKAKKDTPYTAFALSVHGPEKSHHLVFLYRYQAAGRQGHSSGMENGTNRPGMDFRDFFQSRADPALCQAACWNDVRCRAWTWVRPGVQGAQSKCWLKHSVPRATASDCCVSGTKLVK